MLKLYLIHQRQNSPGERISLEKFNFDGLLLKGIDFTKCDMPDLYDVRLEKCIFDDTNIGQLSQVRLAAYSNSITADDIQNYYQGCHAHAHAALAQKCLLNEVGMVKDVVNTTFLDYLLSSIESLDSAIDAFIHASDTDTDTNTKPDLYSLQYFFDLGDSVITGYAMEKLLLKKHPPKQGRGWVNFRENEKPDIDKTLLSMAQAGIKMDLSNVHFYHPTSTYLFLQFTKKRSPEGLDYWVVRQPRPRKEW
jgi:hypothetical protein